MRAGELLLSPSPFKNGMMPYSRYLRPDHRAMRMLVCCCPAPLSPQNGMIPETSNLILGLSACWFIAAQPLSRLRTE